MLYLRRKIADGINQVQAAKNGIDVSSQFHAALLRHLLTLPEVQAFNGTTAYEAPKVQRFRKGDELIIARNAAFLLEDQAERDRFAKAYHKTAALYYKG